MCSEPMEANTHGLHPHTQTLNDHEYCELFFVFVFCRCFLLLLIFLYTVCSYCIHDVYTAGGLGFSSGRL